MEYEKAYELRQADAERNRVRQAWINKAPESTRGKGKSMRPKFEKMEDFYDYEDVVLSIFDKNHKTRSKRERLANVNSLMNEYLEKKEGE